MNLSPATFATILGRKRAVLTCVEDSVKSHQRFKSRSYGIYGRMVEAVTRIDRSGRVVIPKEIRERMGLKEDTTLLVADATDEIVVLKKLDVKELAKRLRQELKGVDVEAIARRVEEESNEQARKEHKALRG